MTEWRTVRDPPPWFEIQRWTAIPHPLPLPPVPLAHETPPGSPAPAHESASPVESGLRLLTDRLDVSAAMLFASEPGGALRLVSAVGTWGGDALALRGLAETLAGEVDVLDVTGAIEGARFAAGARLGSHEGALLVIDPEGRTPDDAWNQAFADAAQTALALVRSQSGGGDVTRVLHEIAVHPGRFDERLDLALVRLADAVGLDGAAYARTDGGQWVPEARFDPSEHLIPSRPVALRETFCAFTTQTDGPFAVQDAAASPLPLSEPGAYLGAPVFVGGKCVGTLSAASHRPRAHPFRDDDLALVEALARWMGSAIGGRDTAQRLAAREADLSAFFDAAPMGMGLAQVVETEGGPDLQIDAINRAGALMMGGEPETLVGTLASQGRLRGFLAHWLDACRTSRQEQRPHRFEVEFDGRDGRRTLATTVTQTGDDDAGTRFLFVTEDTTDAHRADDRLLECEAHIDALVSLAPVTLFATDRAGRLSMSRGRDLGRLGLSTDHALGRPVQDIFGGPDAAAAIAAALGGGEGCWAVTAGDRRFQIQVLARRGAQDRPSGLIGVALGTTRSPSSNDEDPVAEMRSGLLKHLDREIRSPLTSILGYADLLSEDTPPDEVAEVRDVIARSGERLLGALDDLLDLTLLDEDEIEVHPTPVDASAVVAEIAESSRPAAEARRLALNLWCTLPNEPVLLDHRLFGRLVRHLISGAVASASGTRVDIRLTSLGTDAMELNVLGGVPTGGLGIGPNLIHRLARAMGGEAREMPGPEGGWALRLPRVPVPVVQMAPVEMAPIEMTQEEDWTGLTTEYAGDGQ